MKRFTETDKWTKDNWFSDLDPKYKLFWLYLIDNCDNVGVWEVNKKMANFLIGYEYSLEDITDKFGDKIHIFDSGKKWWLRKFVSFQHGILDEESQSKPIISYISLLKKHTLYKEYTNGIHTVQGKGKGKGKGKVVTDTYTEDFELFWKVYPKKTGKGGAFKSWQKSKNRPPISEIVKHIEQLTESDGWKREGGQFIPLPQTWINQSRWDDEASETFISFFENGQTIHGEGLCNGLNRKQHIEKYGRLV